ncbi:hypothetical protein GL305_29435 [Nocardia seriolae]|uniref:Uncharacterized protein n=2 Tax=Nocardia seriolae TaxID=37332 RepID=A0ABC8B267_9NOCA|nr:hypothetical protein [Nocardia seriolae]GEM23765.1 hypothetical protein NS2_20040 [Nocardia seriolae NBRC 15557]APB00502.1 hypothetical protein NS506_06466 [Nocardia seriolae]MTK33944.1 hypothetical protein [Nocardia seriolae]RLP32866.1 hypothetical protein D6158_05915 [Nocardia seriolae]BAW05356.1 conserved hypothetical protein [Nocardia seriolae]
MGAPTVYPRYGTDDRESMTTPNRPHPLLRLGLALAAFLLAAALSATARADPEPGPTITLDGGGHATFSATVAEGRSKSVVLGFTAGPKVTVSITSPSDNAG